MRMLITGAGGMLGHDVREAAARLGHEPIARSRAQLDITDAAAVRAAVRAARPEVVINCAAWTNVDGAEADRAGAQAVNAQGAGQVAAQAAAVGAWTIHVSTDYVFDGTKRAAYLESDPTGPRSVYGETKLAGERAVAAAAGERHTIVRSAWLFGVAGPCFPATMLRLAKERDELTVVDDQVGCPTFTGHLAEALVALAGDPISGVVHVAAGGECSWWAFAREIVAAAGVEIPVRAISTDQFPRPAARPAYSVLRSERGAPQLPDWRDGLAAYMTQTTEVAA
jgi:dTDP-4-dehydrorhamnose reductase